MTNQNTSPTSDPNCRGRQRPPHPLLKAKCGSILLEARGYGRNRPSSYHPQAECCPLFQTRKWKRRIFTPERQKAINEKVSKLLQARAIREVDYPDWLDNVVLVKKENGKWRLCIDFTDVNQACPKDSFPLPRIDLIVDATAGHELLSFMDAFSGYNQIRMEPNDQEKTSFMTGQGTYYYQVMPFGLKNAGATYQRLVNRMFQKQIGASMEVYIDDMLVKSVKAELHMDHLAESFQVLKDYKMKLKPTKWAFGISVGKFLGFIVNNRASRF